MIDGRTEQEKGGAADASKQGEEKKALSQTKSAWTADQVEGKQTQPGIVLSVSVTHRYDISRDAKCSFFAVFCTVFG